MVFHSRSSGATHTLCFFLTLCVLLPLPSLTNALTPTQRCTQVFTKPSAPDMLITLHSNKTNGFPRQISVDWIEPLSSLLLAISSAKARREINDLSECQCGVSLGLIHKHKARCQKKGTTSKCGVMVQHGVNHAVSAGQIFKPSPSYILCLMQQKGACLCSISGNEITAIEHSMQPKVCGMWWCFMAWLLAIGSS